MRLAVQYYRPPFPDGHRWSGDLAVIAATGIDAVQLWVTWGWVEAEPGTYRFDDYDRLIELAAEAGLQVVLSTIAEIHPFWIHRVVPDSAMVDHRGQRVVSVPRRENHAGLTPGGCTDHPEVRRRLGAFLDACAGRYGGLAHLAGWDVWNETRWAVHARGHVCYCPHTLRAFHEWLEACHGGLNGLNEHWRRRYVDWKDVMPGTVPALLYTQTVEFQRFLTWRAGQHMAFRAERIRRHDGVHAVGGHCISPTVFSPGMDFEQAVSRGNDWDHVKSLDSYGLSMYPDFFIHDEADFGARIESARSACGSRPLWISELEAAPTGIGFTAGRPVGADDVRRWLWASAGHGARAAVLWQWYDELVGEESAAFGLSGHDGQAPERLAAVAETAAAFDEHRELLDHYRPEPGRVGVLVDESSYYLDWAQHGDAADMMSGSVIGYLRALERCGVPYTVLHGRHVTADDLARLRLVIMPAPLVVADEAGEHLAGWVRRGGVLLVEPELDGWSDTGFYRDPEDRPLARTLGLRGHGRRPADDGAGVAVRVGDSRHHLRAAQWREPVGAADDVTPAFSVDLPLGAGRVVGIGTFAGLAYYRDRYTEFESFVHAVARFCDALGALQMEEPRPSETLVRAGPTTGGWLVFVTNPSGEEETLRLRLPEMPTGDPVELLPAAAAAPGVDDATVTIPAAAGWTRVVYLPGA